jgi:cyclophilin family peptidyl-prolyl cis-trans isomerase
MTIFNFLFATLFTATVRRFGYLVIFTIAIIAALPAHATTVRLQTTLGNIDIELYDTATPRTVANFLAYLNSGAYNNSFFHRSVPGFIIQGGGYTWDNSPPNVNPINKNPPVVNEFSTARSNLRGTIAMAKVGGDPNSATSEWFINLANNSANLDTQNGGFTVFGKVTDASMTVVDAIAALRLVNAGGAFAELPTINYTSGNITRANLAMVDRVTIISEIPPVLPTNFQGLWWAGEAESGWGMSLTQHRNVIFGAIYTYDAQGQPIWYVMPGCTLANGTTTVSCAGQAFRVDGGTRPTIPWAGQNRQVTNVGSYTITFSTSNNARFDFTINGVTNSKTISTQTIATGTTPPPLNYTDLWWAGEAESGWGIALTQQFSTIFATWFTYDATGKPIWYVAPNCAIIEAVCSSDLFQVTGGSPITGAWTGQNRIVTRVGNIRIAFMGPGAADMTYTINNVSSSRSISRQPF